MIRPAGIFDVLADPSGMDSSRRMAPEALAKWLDTTLYAKHMVIGENYLVWINQEQSARASILLDLARALYEREHGKPPKSDRDLIGKYLDHLPDGAIDPGPP